MFEKARKPAEQTATAFLEHLQQHQYTRAAALLMEPAEPSITIKRLQDYVEVFERGHGTIQGWTLEDWEVMVGDETYASLEYSLLGSRQSDGKISLWLQPVNGTWLIKEIMLGL